MKNSTMRTMLIGIGTCAILLGVLAAVLLGVPASNMSGANGQLQIEVFDGQTEQPLSGVTVVIPEIGQSYTTDDSGLTPEITIPLVTDARFDKILRKPWGEVTLLCYKEEYIPYALFYAQVWENQSRQGPRVYMFTEKSSKSSAPFSIIEGPHRLWVEDMVDKFNPKNSSNKEEK